MVSYIKNKLALLDEHTLEVVKKSSASMVVKVVGMIVGLVVSIFLGRTLGADGLGIINLANQIVGLLLVLTMLGMDNVLIKHIAIAFERKDWQSVGNNLFTSLRINGLLATIFSITGILLADPLSNHLFHNPQLKIPLIIAFAMMVPQTLSRIFAAGLSGFRKIWQGSLVNNILSGWVVGLGLLVLHFAKIEINVVNVAILYAFGRIVVTISMTTYWKTLFRFSGQKKWVFKPMLTMAMPLLLVTATSVIAANADTIMLGWLSDTRQVGLYSVAARIAFLTSFFLQVSNASIGPKLASLFADKKLGEIAKMVKQITFGLLLVAFLSLTTFILGGKFILNLWGTEFQEAYRILVILSIGQFVNISTGCSGLLLIMCGYEKIHGYVSLTSVTLNLILNFYLINKFGALGAATATAITVGGENLIKLLLAKRKVGISTIPILKA